jgi:hypothetical protein
LHGPGLGATAERDDAHAAADHVVDEDRAGG